MGRPARTRLTVDQCGRLDMARLLADRVLVPGRAIFAEVVEPRPTGFRLWLDADMTNPRDAWVKITHADLSGLPNYLVNIVGTAQPLGGVRWWFACPYGRGRARVLLLPPGGRRFASRAALGVPYQVQRENVADRAQRRARKARVALEQRDPAVALQVNYNNPRQEV